MDNESIFNFDDIISQKNEQIYKNIKYQYTTNTETRGLINSINNNFEQIQSKLDDDDFFKLIKDKDAVLDLLYPNGTYIFIDNDDYDPNRSLPGKWKLLSQTQNPCLITAYDEDEYAPTNKDIDIGEKNVTLEPENSALTNVITTSQAVSHFHMAFENLPNGDTRQFYDPKDTSHSNPKKLHWMFTTCLNLNSDQTARRWVLKASWNNAKTFKVVGGFSGRYYMFVTNYNLDSNAMYDNITNQMYTDSVTGSHKHSGITISSQNVKPHNNMMPYYAVNIWHRDDNSE